VPTASPTVLPTKNPTNRPTGAPTNETLDTLSVAVSEVVSVNTTGTDREDDLLIILSTISGMVLMGALLGVGLRYMTFVRRERRLLQIHIEAVELAVRWPELIDIDMDQTQIKRRALTFPQDELGRRTPSPVGRRRVHTGISLGDISRGGEAYGLETGVFII